MKRSDLLARPAASSVLLANLATAPLVRPFGRGSVIGPVFAASEEDALTVIRPLIVEQKNRFLRIDLDTASGPLCDFLEQSGVPVREQVTRMSLGRPWPFSIGGPRSQFALASQATG